MKKLLLLIFWLPNILFAQNGYEIDEGNIVVSKVIENVKGSKDEIYGRAKTYFTRAYVNTSSVIQTDDKENGLIIAKGLYDNVETFSLGYGKIKAYHIIRIDIKEGRARIICSASTLISYSPDRAGNESEYRIVDYAPITNKKARAVSKGIQKKAFDNLIAMMNNSVNSLSEALESGGILNTEKEDW